MLGLRRSTTTDAIRDAARHADADGFLAALARVTTRCPPEFEGGTDLSIGQWQRIASVRAFFPDAPWPRASSIMQSAKRESSFSAC